MYTSPLNTFIVPILFDTHILDVNIWYPCRLINDRYKINKLLIYIPKLKFLVVDRFLDHFLSG